MAPRKWDVFKVDRVTVRPRGVPTGARCKVRLEWYPPGHDGRMAVKTVTGTRPEVTQAAGVIIASGYAAPATWTKAPTATTLRLTTLGQLLAAWLYTVEDTALGSDLSPKSRETYRGSVARILGPPSAPRLRHHPIETWTAQTALAWSKREARRYTRSTHKADRGVLRQAWQWAVAQGHLTRPDPLAGLAWPKRWAGRPHARYTPTVQEVYATLQAMPDTPDAPAARRARLILTIVWATGARIGEVCALRREDVDLTDPEDAWVILQGAVAGETTGKGRDDRAHRPVMLTPQAALLLQAHVAALPSDQDRLWPGRLGPLTDSVRGAIRRACADSGLTHWSPHGLRRLMVDDLVRDGVDVATAAEITGHSIETMLKRYRQVSQADKRRALKRVRRRGLTRQVIDFPGAEEG